MIRIPGPIPITIYPGFWLVAALIGFLFSMSLVGTLIWILIIFVSVLFHEFGHALTARAFGQKPRIELVAMGGLTYHEGRKLSFFKQFFIILDGPVFGFILVAILIGLMRIPALHTGAAGAYFHAAMLINFVWTVVNLLPIVPLDGGQLLRVSLERIFGAKGFRYALITGIVVSILFTLGFFLYRFILAGAIFSLFAFQNYIMLRQVRFYEEADRDEGLQAQVAQIEQMIQKGDKHEAATACEEIRAKTKKGMIFTAVTEYLAILKYEQSDFQAAYDLLFPLESHLSPEGLAILHKAAFEVHDFALVVKLASPCFQAKPSAETAVRNALAHATQSEVVPAIGWLQTAIDEGLENVNDVLGDKNFDPVRADPHFQAFTKKVVGES